MEFKLSSEIIKLLLFSFFVCLITYGFALTNFSLTIDSETPIPPDYLLSLGRWGINLFRCHLLHNHIPYFTLLLSLAFLSLASIELVKLFRLEGVLKYVFCALFLTFPQMAYQLVFTLQADAVAFGYLLAILSVRFFIKSTDGIFSLKSIVYFVLASVLFMGANAMYQALMLVPVICYLMWFFQNTYNDNFNLKLELQKMFLFGGMVILGLVLYYVSVKVLCPPVEQGYLSSYLSGSSEDQLLKSYEILRKNLTGNMYYGDKLYIIITLISLVLIGQFVYQKVNMVYRIGVLLLLLVIPFSLSFLITNGYHPPRLYGTSGIVFAFVIVHFIRNFKENKIILVFCGVVCLINIYFITQLFISNNRIFNHDKDLARKIDFTIRATYPQFDENNNYVYFHGGLPFSHHDRMRLPESEVFGGSLFCWDNGSNYRIKNFFTWNDIAYYKLIDDKGVLTAIQDSIAPMPVWPHLGSVKMINNVVVVKLNTEKGEKLWIE